MTEEQMAQEIEDFVLHRFYASNVKLYIAWMNKPNPFFSDHKKPKSAKQMAELGRIEEVYEWIFKVVLR